MKRTAFLPLLPLAFLAGCALDPVDSKPETKTPAQWSASAKTGDATVADTWWKAFGDPGLDTVVERALNASPSIDAAFARVRAARAGAELASATLWPTLSANGSWSRQRTTESQIFNGIGGRTYNTQAVGATLGYEIDLWGASQNAGKAAEARFRSAHADLAAARLLVAAETAKLWFDYRQALADRTVLAETAHSRESVLTLYADREKAGIIGGDDVARARLDAAQARYDIEGAELQIGLLRNALAAAIGETPGDAKLPDDDAALPASVPVVPVSVPSALLTSRPDIAAADLRLDATLASEGLARSNFYPNITLAASGGLSSVSGADLFNAGSRLWSFGPTVSLPIFSGGENDAKLENSRADFDNALASYRASVLAAFRETEDALLTAERLEKQETLISAVVSAATETFDFAKSRYANGVSSNLEVVIAERDALTARRQFIRVRFDRLRASANLARVLGGGWNRDTAIDKSVDETKDREERRDRAREQAKEADAVEAKAKADAAEAK